MNRDAIDDIDDRILQLITKDSNIPNNEMSGIIGIPENEIAARIRNFSDTRSIILIVDDDMDSLLPLKRSLERENYKVVEAYSGQEALQKASAETPDVILLDLMMPGMDGYEVCNRLKKEMNLKNTQIIMLTARDDVGDKIRGLDIGADDYVTKPFNLSELKARIKTALRRTRNL
ncbi:MAG: response regulator [Candidatus Methanoperedens sp.]|nr:response regulator [Candidatus Methanoperedens sp.]